MKDLAIIIVTLNNQQLLENCLAAIYKNTEQTNLEIIVVDNGSTDNTANMVKAQFPQAKLVVSQENLGFAKANNLGIRLAAARYILLLNNDTIVKENAFAQMLAFMDQHQEAGACGPKLLNVGGSIQRQGGLLGKKFYRATKPTIVDFVIGACLMVRKEAIDQVGLMDENLFFYNDDLDWCLSIRKAGWKIYFLPQAEVMHYGGYSSKRTFNRRLFVEGFKGGLYFCRKHYGEMAFQLYRHLLLFLFLFLILSPNKDKRLAYREILAYAWRGQTPKPVVK